jgi:hypothetical protein
LNEAAAAALRGLGGIVGFSQPISLLRRCMIEEMTVRSFGGDATIVPQCGIEVYFGRSPDRFGLNVHAFQFIWLQRTSQIVGAAGMRRKFLPV